MNNPLPPDEQALATLQRTVAGAVTFFNEVDPNLCDGFWTAHDALSHIVYWHCRAVEVAQALAESRLPDLPDGSYAELNRCACDDHQSEPLPVLAARLAEQQKALDAALRHLPDWGIDFPVKAGARPCSVEDRVAGIESHIRHHVAELRRVRCLGIERIEQRAG